MMRMIIACPACGHSMVTRWPKFVRPGLLHKLFSRCVQHTQDHLHWACFCGARYRTPLLRDSYPTVHGEIF